MAGATCRDILKDSRSAKCCIFQYKNVSKMGRVRSPKRRVRDDDIIVGMWPNRRCIGGSSSGISGEILGFKIKILWQAQYLVSFKGDFTCCAHWK